MCSFTIIPSNFFAYTNLVMYNGHIIKERSVRAHFPYSLYRQGGGCQNI